jgi:N-glycosylase/DNA lyase
LEIGDLKSMSSPIFCCTETATSPFDFEATVWAHGWAALRPFTWDESSAELSRTQRLATGQVVHLRLRPDGQAGPVQPVQVEVEAAGPLDALEQAELRRAVRRMLRLDEELAEFYQLATEFAHWPLRLQPGGGRLLRCPTLFEDIVYTLCTTNITWSGTKRMVDRLTAKLGQPFPGRSFSRGHRRGRARFPKAGGGAGLPEQLHLGIGRGRG